MSIYAFLQGNVIQQIIPPRIWGAPDPASEAFTPPEVWAEWVARVGQPIALSDQFSPEFSAMCVEITGMVPTPEIGWVTADGGKTFAAP
ncbi:hypothetical protein KTE68_21925 [Burkholderia multivorans]|uniref:hypothetical protein n=1 Tax=Burkholderia multivorans TaxID=87883 RepID=UPI001C234DB6|nr:hypothetical protein [Burkholderia multivorans]MBU9502812.1 hypothetical protein [Burkholderia multivorans]